MALTIHKGQSRMLSLTKQHAEISAGRKDPFIGGAARAVHKYGVPQATAFDNGRWLKPAVLALTTQHAEGRRTAHCRYSSVEQTGMKRQAMVTALCRPNREPQPRRTTA